MLMLVLQVWAMFRDTGGVDAPEDGHDMPGQYVKSRYNGKVRIFGYSAGAAVGAYVGMILEGTLDTDDGRVNPVPDLKDVQDESCAYSTTAMH